MLYEKHNYLNKNIEYLVSNEIIEYDMRSAGFSLIKKFGLLDNNKIQYLESLEKKKRQIQIGLYQRQDRSLGVKLNEKFVDARKWFFESNGLEDSDVLAIKKDAIMTTKRCHNKQWDNIEFSEKNIYTSYYYIHNHEFYFNKDTIDVKGISDELLELHRDYMLDFLSSFFYMMETTTRKKKMIQLITEFSHYYKARELEIGYYRELNRQSLFRIDENLFGQPLGLSSAGNVKDLEIGYNHLNYVIPLIGILV